MHHSGKWSLLGKAEVEKQLPSTPIKKSCKQGL